MKNTALVRNHTPWAIWENHLRSKSVLRFENLSKT
jgi:hypothetical protein